jgi:ABC-type branched-subunit amino acid transport system substrate-binding protein
MNAIAIMGAVNSGTTRALDQAVQSAVASAPQTQGSRAHAPLIMSPIASHKDLQSPSILRMGPNDEKGIDDLVVYLRDHGSENFLSVYVSDDWGQGLRDSLTASCTKLGCRVVEQFCTGDHATNDKVHATGPRCAQDIAELVDRLHARLANIKNAAVGLFFPESGEIVRQLRERGDTPAFFSTTINAVRSRSKDEDNDDEKDGVIIGTVYNVAGRTTGTALAFRKRFEHCFAISADNYAAQGYDAALVLVRAYARMQRLNEPPADYRKKLRTVIDDLWKEESLSTVLGVVKIMENARTLETEIRQYGYDSSGKMGLPPVDLRVAHTSSWSPKLVGLGLGVLMFVFYFWLASIQHPFASRALPSLLPIFAALFAAGRPVGVTAADHALQFWPDFQAYFLSFSVCALLAFTGMASRRRDRSLMCRAEPFRSILLLGLHVPQLRRIWYRGLLRETEQLIRYERERERVQAKDLPETYVELPVAMESAQNGSSVEQSAPAKYLVGELTSPQPRRILIEGPGGIGKTALLREVVCRLVTSCQRNPRHPIPLLCSLLEKSMVDAGRAALGRDYVDESMFKWQLRKGHFVLVLNDFTETGSRTAEVASFLESDEGLATSLLISTRVLPDLRASVARAQHRTSVTTIICEPKPLDGRTLPEFLAAYRADPLPRPIQDACTASDGTYLQLLIRLAIKNPGAVSVAELYKRALKDLVRSDESLIQQAGQICLAFYWRTGSRIVPYGHEDEAHRAMVRRLIKAGILKAELESPTQRAADEAAFVRFRQDAFQTYLTARALINQRKPLTGSLV